MRCFGAEFLHILRNRVVIDSIEQEIVMQGMNAVDVEIVHAPRARRAALLRVAADLHSGHQPQQSISVPEIKWGSLDGVVVDDRTNRGIVG
jgi:hypothetical protein